MKRRMVIVTAVAAALVAGCGGGDQLSKAEYQEKLDSTGSQLESAFERFTTELQNVGSGQGSLDEAAQEIENIQEELNAAADDLSDVEPPEDVGAAHDQLVEGLRGLANDLDEFKQAVEEGDTGKIDEFAQKAESLDSIQQLEKAGNELESKGYRLGSEGSG